MVGGAEWLKLFRAFGAKRVLLGFDPGVARSALTPGYYLERLRRWLVLFPTFGVGKKDSCVFSDTADRV